MEFVELVTLLAKALVDEQEAVVVVEIKGARTTILELRVAQDDVGKIIGKHGRNVNALRTILTAAAMKHHIRTHLEVVEPNP